MKIFILIVSFCNPYNDYCDYAVHDTNLSYDDCITIKEQQEANLPQYTWECEEVDTE